MTRWHQEKEKRRLTLLAITSSQPNLNYVKVVVSVRSFLITWIGLSRVQRLHQHSIGYPEDSFTGQKTQPTASKYWRKSWPAIVRKRLKTHFPPCYKWTSEKEKPYHSGSSPARQSPKQQAGLSSVTTHKWILLPVVTKLYIIHACALHDVVLYTQISGVNLT